MSLSENNSHVLPKNYSSEGWKIRAPRNLHVPQGTLHYSQLASSLSLLLFAMDRMIENEMLCKFKNWYHNSFVRYRAHICKRRAGQLDMLHETRQADETWQPGIWDKNIPKNERQLQVGLPASVQDFYAHARSSIERETIRYIAAKEIESNWHELYVERVCKSTCPHMPLLKPTRTCEACEFLS